MSHRGIPEEMKANGAMVGEAIKHELGKRGVPESAHLWCMQEVIVLADAIRRRLGNAGVSNKDRFNVAQVIVTGLGKIFEVSEATEKVHGYEQCEAAAEQIAEEIRKGAV
jgi:hypothetical protein